MDVDGRRFDQGPRVFSPQYCDAGGSVVVDLSMVSARSSECTDHFLGLFQVRDDYGRWYEIELIECSGCGEVWQDGTALGEGCMQTAGAPAALLALLTPEG